jgi:hypothetical protein
MVNSNVLQLSRFHLSLPTKFYSSALNGRPHSCIHHSHIALRNAVTISTPQTSTEVKTLLPARYRRELSSKSQKWVTQNKHFWALYGNFIIMLTRTHDFARSSVRCMQCTGIQVFLVDQFKLMSVKWYFPLRFHDSSVYVLATFSVHFIRPFYIILLDLIPVTP